jgi:hypothetical protein
LKQGALAGIKKKKEQAVKNRDRCDFWWHGCCERRVFLLLMDQAGQETCSGLEEKAKSDQELEGAAAAAGSGALISLPGRAALLCNRGDDDVLGALSTLLIEVLFRRSRSSSFAQFDVRKHAYNRHTRLFVVAWNQRHDHTS